MQNTNIHIVAHLAEQTDFLLIETVSSLKQAEGALRATDKTENLFGLRFLWMILMDQNSLW